MTDPQIISRWLHPVMSEQPLVILGQPLHLCRFYIRCAEAVGAMFFRCTAELVQGGLQAIGQLTVTFTTLYNMHGSPTAAGQSELIQ